MKGDKFMTIMLRRYAHVARPISEILRTMSDREFDTIIDEVNNSP